jgi:hypothetical protein
MGELNPICHLLALLGAHHIFQVGGLRVKAQDRGIVGHNAASIFGISNVRDHHLHHLALQPFVGFRLLSQVSPSSSILSCLLPVFDFQLL